MSFEIVFIGETNDGKTTIVSSLTEDDEAVISPIPGTTKVAHRHKLNDAHGNTILMVCDTPGFEETDDLHAWFVENASSAGNLSKKFIEAHENDPRWNSDIELLRPIAEGALVVYVAASNRKPQATDFKQLELVRIAGADRIALINEKPGKDYKKDWQNVLKREIGIVRSYSPLTAGIRQRLELIEKLADCADSAADSILAARDALEQDWNDRLQELARKMLATVYKTAKASAFSDESKEDAQRKLSSKLEKIEASFRRSALESFNHKNLRIDSDFFRADITVTDTWRTFGIGMTKRQAMIYGAFVGAVMGLAIDAMFGGVTGGGWTALGGAIGAGSAAFFIYRPFDLVEIGRDGYEAKVELRSQLLGVLLDRMLIYSRCMLRVSHGDRPQEAIDAETVLDTDSGERLSFVGTWEKNELQAWGKVVGKMKNAPKLEAIEENEPKAYETVLKQIVWNLNMENK